MSAAPRLPCSVCGRSVAVIATATGGKLARHDPPERGPLLLSCDGSLRAVPPGSFQLPRGATLFDPDVQQPAEDPEERAPAQGELF